AVRCFAVWWLRCFFLSPVSGGRPHRCLPSFPTRRSSDLLGAIMAATTNLLFAWLSLQEPTQLLLALVISADNLGAGIATVAFIRSEEHTSELQSRENLVCRLLLEKKKQNRSPTPPPALAT